MRIVQLTARGRGQNAPLVIEPDFGGDDSTSNTQEGVGADVAQERANAASGDDSQFAVRIVQLEKVYISSSSSNSPPIKALNKLCLALRPNECFGLLGPNGAGKVPTAPALQSRETRRV